MEKIIGKDGVQSKEVPEEGGETIEKSEGWEVRYFGFISYPTSSLSPLPYWHR